MERFLTNRRLSRFERRDESQSIELADILRRPVLTKRDKAVLLSLYHHRCLTTEQIAEIHFHYRENDPATINSQASIMARRRLRKMFDYRLIERFFVDAGENNGSSQAHIVLDNLGAQIVGGLLNQTLEEMHWRCEVNDVRLPYLQHTIEVNEFYLQLLRSARANGHQVGGYQTEPFFEFSVPGQKKKVRLKPDAYGRYFAGDSGFHFFHECDRGTETVDVFQRKQHRYAALYATDEYRRYFDTFPIVLTVTTSWERAVELRDVIYRIDQTDIQWLFTSEDLVRQNVLGTIWLGKEYEPVGLL